MSAPEDPPPWLAGLEERIATRVVALLDERDDKLYAHLDSQFDRIRAQNTVIAQRTRDAINRALDEHERIRRIAVQLDALQAELVLLKRDTEQPHANGNGG